MCIAGYWINVSANCSSSFAYLHLSGCVVPSGRGRHSGDSHDMTATEMAVSDSNLQLFHGHDNQFSYAFERNCSRSSTPAIALNTFKHNRFIEYVLFFFMTCLKHCNFMVPILSLNRLTGCTRLIGVLLFITSVQGMRIILPQIQNSKALIFSLYAVLWLKFHTHTVPTTTLYP